MQYNSFLDAFIVGSSDGELRLYNAEDYQKPFDLVQLGMGKLIESKQIQLKNKNASKPANLQKVKTDKELQFKESPFKVSSLDEGIKSISVSGDQTYIAVGLSSGKIIIFKSGFVFSKVYFATYHHHDDMISDMIFSKRSDYLNLLFSISRGGVMAVTSLNQAIVIYKVNLDNAKLTTIMEMPGMDSMLINQAMTMDIFRVDFNYFEMAKSIRRCSFKYKILHHSLTTPHQVERLACAKHVLHE